MTSNQTEPSQPQPSQTEAGIRLNSVQIGISRTSTVARKGATGIAKDPVSRAEVTAAGLVGDVVVDLDNHGGPDQAVYIYTQDDYDWWEQKLGRTLTSGIFGENLTFSNGLAGPNRSTEIARIGDQYSIGDVLLEVTAPRIPCKTFADRLELSDFVQTFRAAERPGMYCRVLNPGHVGPGDQILVHRAPESNLGIAEAFRLYYDRNVAVDDLRRALRSPVSVRQRDDFERRLARSSGRTG